MQSGQRAAITVVLFGLVLCVSWAQDQERPPAPRPHSAKTTRPGEARTNDRSLTADDRLSVMAAALDSKIPRFRERDCSHLVHAIYERAGFPYTYVSSDDLYDGVKGFRRVVQPEPGDLVVWYGHAGIVIRPSRHVFFSFLHGGPGIDDYTSRYWKGRGQPRFYRYVKNDRCEGCALAGGQVSR